MMRRMRFEKCIWDWDILSRLHGTEEIEILKISRVLRANVGPLLFTVQH